MATDRSVGGRMDFNYFPGGNVAFEDKGKKVVTRSENNEVVRMNYFDWPLEQARAYMKEHAFESDVQIASETLRYSTDLFAQALDYRLGYDQFWRLRRDAARCAGGAHRSIHRRPTPRTLLCSMASNVPKVVRKAA